MSAVAVTFSPFPPSSYSVLPPVPEWGRNQTEDISSLVQLHAGAVLRVIKALVI